jgi:hypothetical protein
MNTVPWRYFWLKMCGLCQKISRGLHARREMFMCAHKMIVPLTGTIAGLNIQWMDLLLS